MNNKKYLFNENIISYRDGDGWNFVVNGKEFKSSDVTKATIKKSGFLVLHQQPAEPPHQGIGPDARKS